MYKRQALAGGRLAKHPGETSRRLQEDLYVKSKYDSTAEQDARIIRRVAELADQRGVSTVSYTHLDVYKRQEKKARWDWTLKASAQRSRKFTGAWLPMLSAIIAR